MIIVISSILLLLAFAISNTELNKDVFGLKRTVEERLAQKAELLRQEAIKKAAEDLKKKNYLLGKFDPETMEHFFAIPTKYGISGYKMYLREEALNAFMQMSDAAAKENVDIKIASATRNFDYQKNIWNQKWTGVTLQDSKNLAKSIPDEVERFKKILEYSAVPGTSRHHFGTDIDINDANVEYFKTERGEKVYAWLLQNAFRFGYCQVYTLKGTTRPTGYNEEKWHWSYIPVAKNLTQEYMRLVKNEDIKGFNGDESVSKFNLIDDYVLGINPECI